VLGGLFYWLVILAALMVAFNSLDLAYVTDLIGRVLLFVPKVMVAVLILVFGAYFRPFRQRGAAMYLTQPRVGEAGLVGRIALYAIMIFVIMRSHSTRWARRYHPPDVPHHHRGHCARPRAGIRSWRQKRAAELIESWTARKSEQERAAHERAKQPVL
jgi:hypothetical protein